MPLPVLCGEVAFLKFSAFGEQGIMIVTERLYDNGHIKEFDSVVTECKKDGNCFLIALASTAFFPNGGGQLADEGSIDGVTVKDVNEINGVIYHSVEREFEVGSTVHGVIDWSVRLPRMQNHTGEHIVCGVAHNLFGYENTGFHMGTFGITADLSGPLTEEEVRKIELIANRAVFDNVEVTCFYPTEQELETIDYRSKLELTEDVRLVKIDGYDLCACCAPHVLRTGEIGIIKILSHQSHRGGTRLLLKCGYDALEDYCQRCASISAVSASLCAKETEIAQAVEQLKAEKARLDYQIEQLNKEKTLKYIKKFKATDANVCVFTDDLDADGLRETVNAGKLLCDGIVGVFVQAENGYKYCLGSNSVNLSAFAKQFNAALGGRGGGKPEMIQGSVTAPKEDILKFLSADEV